MRETGWRTCRVCVTMSRGAKMNFMLTGLCISVRYSCWPQSRWKEVRDRGGGLVRIWIPGMIWMVLTMRQLHDNSLCTEVLGLPLSGVFPSKSTIFERRMARHDVKAYCNESSLFLVGYQDFRDLHRKHTAIEPHSMPGGDLNTPLITLLRTLNVDFLVGWCNAQIINFTLKGMIGEGQVAEVRRHLYISSSPASPPLSSLSCYTLSSTSFSPHFLSSINYEFFRSKHEHNISQ